MGDGEWLLGRNRGAEGCRDPGDGDGQCEWGLEWVMGDKEGDGRQGWRQELRTGMGTSQGKRQKKGRIRLWEGARQVEAKIPPSRPHYSVRGRGPLVGRALPLGRAPPPPQPRLPACSRPAAQGSPLSEF